jgi:hypothetical protein
MKLAFLPFLLLASCCFPDHGKQPLTPFEGQKVTRATIYAHPENKPPIKVTLTKPADVSFVVARLQGLDSRCYDHSSPEFDLELETSSGNSVGLRVSSLEIGPAAPASALNQHWFPKDDALYQFLRAKAYPDASR